MNTAQLKICLKQLKDLYKSKTSDISAKCTSPGKTLSKKERADLIRKGKVQLKKECVRLDRYDSVMDSFDFSKYEYSDERNDSKFNKLMDVERKRYLNFQNHMMSTKTNDEVQRILNEYTD